MSKSNLAMVTVKNYNGTKDKPAKADNNGNMPVILMVSAGRVPNRTVLSGTVAQNEGLDVNHTYIVNVIEREPDSEYGRQFGFSIVREVTSVKDIMEAKAELGEGTVYNIDSINPEGNTQQEEATRRADVQA